MATSSVPLSQAYPGATLFAYCTEVLRLSEHEACNRLEAARAARRFPVLIEKLHSGALSLTTVRLLAPHLTGENAQELLAAASGKSKREVEELLARLFPEPDVRASVRKLPVAKPRPSFEAAPRLGLPATGSPGSLVAARLPSATAPPPTTPASRTATTTPLAPDRYRITFTASAKTCEKLRLAQDLLRHAVPSGDAAEIIDRALTALLEDLARKRFAATELPRSRSRASTGSRDVPASVKRQVWLRDGGGCAFVARSGRRCSERGFLQFHHLDPYAVGGEATVTNIQLRCRPHNVYEARLFYGEMRPTAADVEATRVSRRIPPPGRAQRGGLLVPERVGADEGRRYGDRRQDFSSSGSL